MRILSLLAVPVAATALLAGCASGTGTTASPAPGGSGGIGNAPTSASTSQASTSQASSAPATQATTQSSGGEGGGTSSGTPRCHTGDLALTQGAGGAAAGTWSLNLVLTNKSGHTCTIYGYPGVSWVTGDDGTQVGDPLTRDASGPKKTITLTSGAASHALILVPQSGNYDSGTCKPVAARGLRVYPPDETASTYLAFPQTVCSAKGVGVGRVQAAASGKGTQG